MIIFDLDGCLADCEHRRHFVDPKKQPVQVGHCISLDLQTGKTYSSAPKFKPDYQSFYEACDKDTPIEPVIECWNDQISLMSMTHYMIWSGRCESVREKTEKWLKKNVLCFSPYKLKMRPIGDSTPDDELKERWLDEALSEGKTIDYVFDDRPKVVRMWRRRGIFVFNCCQHDEEF